MRKYVFVMVTVMILSVGAKISFGSTGKWNGNVYYKSVDIVKGDTLWEIAEKYKIEDISTNNYVLEIKKFNNMKSDKIKVGQEIIIPIYVQDLE